MRAIRHRVRAAILMMVIGSGISASAATATWTGGHTTANWGNSNNWQGLVAPTFDNTLEITFYSSGAGNLTNFIQATRTIRSLTFDENVDSNVIIRLTSQTTGGNATGLRFESDNPSTTSPSITVESGASANIDIGGEGTAGTMGNISLSSTLAVTHNGSGLLTFSRPIQETTAGITKLGSGTLTLAASNAYSGITTVSAGSLILGANGSVGSSSVLDVASGATLDVSAVSGGFVLGDSQTLRGNGTIVGDTTVSGTLSPGNSIGALTFADNLTLDLNITSVFQINGFTAGAFDLVSGSSGGTVAFGGTLNLFFSDDFSTSGSVKIFDFENYSGGFGSFSATGLADGYSASFDNGTGLVTVVPEPSTYALLALAAAALGAHVVRRRRSKS
jgi:autotransporter-associated beta strand protein